MSCARCGDRGMVRVRYEDGSPDEFGICLCAVGQDFRREKNGAGRPIDGALWRLWAARERVDPARVAPLEELVDAGDLAGVAGVVERPSGSIADAMRTRRTRL